MKEFALTAGTRLFALVAPLLLFSMYARHAFEQARQQEHHGDVGLGMAMLLALICIAMILGFLVDFIVQIKRRRKLACITDAFALLVLVMPFGWVACNWFDFRECIACKIPLEIFSYVLSLLN